jgi:hypothetical protein
MKPTSTCMSFADGGVGQFVTLNSHFSALQYRPYSRSVSKNSAHVILVLQWILLINEDIFEVVNNEVAHIRPQAIFYISLERRWCISQPEWHDPIFELTISGPEGHLELIALFNSDKIICAAYIYVFALPNLSKISEICGSG